MIKKITNDNLSDLMKYVKREPAINLFIIGDLEQFGLDNDYLDAYLQYNNQDITGCVLRYYSNVVIYSHFDQFDVEEILNLLRTINGLRISGKKSVMDQIVPHLKDIKSKEICYFSKLENKDHLEEIKIPIQTATVDDLPKLHELAQMAGFDPANYIESNTNKLNKKAGRIYFIEDSNKNIISSAATSIESSVSAMIGGVSTHIDYRNKGYASQVVSKISKDLLEEGKTPCLFFFNPKAGSIYHRLGYIDIDMWTMVKLNDNKNNA